MIMLASSFPPPLANPANINMEVNLIGESFFTKAFPFINAHMQILSFCLYLYTSLFLRSDWTSWFAFLMFYSSTLMATKIDST